MKPIATAVLIAGLAIALDAQSPKPTFEVTSIKKLEQAPTLRGFPPPAIRGGTVTLLSSTVASLIQLAYNLRDFQVVEGPDWVRKDLFEVQARAAGEPSRADVLLMLQSLLEDRFGLRLRTEQREIRFFAMVPARNDGRPGPYLHRGPDAPTESCDRKQIDEIEKARVKPAAGMAMAMASIGCGSLATLAELASRLVELPVFDRTGLTGRWSATLYYAPDPNVNVGRSFGPASPVAVTPDPNLPSFQTALQEQLGLKLEATRGPVDVMVIEAVRQPTAN